MDLDSKFLELRKSFDALGQKVIDSLKNKTQALILDDERLQKLKNPVVREILGEKEFSVFYDDLLEIADESEFRALFALMDVLEKKTVAEIAFKTIMESLNSKEIASFSLNKELPGFLRLRSAIEDFPRHERAYAYLYAFDLQDEPIVIDGGYRIRKVNLFEEAYTRQEPMFVGHFSNPKYIVETVPGVSVGKFSRKNETENEVPSATLAIEYQPREDLANLISMLRIIEPSAVGIQIIHYTLLPDKMMIRTQIIAPTEVFPTYFGRCKKDFMFTKENVRMFNPLWTNFRSIKKNRRLNRAIRRFNVALCSEDPEDQLVDLIISLETLFQAMGFKVTFLSSFLLGLESGVREVSLGILEKSYRIRNGIVHGGSIKKKDNKLVDQLLSLVARILGFAITMKLSGAALNDRIKGAYIREAELRKLEEDVSKWISRTDYPAS